MAKLWFPERWHQIYYCFLAIRGSGVEGGLYNSSDTNDIQDMQDNFGGKKG